MQIEAFTTHITTGSHTKKSLSAADTRKTTEPLLLQPKPCTTASVPYPSASEPAVSRGGCHIRIESLLNSAECCKHMGGGMRFDITSQQKQIFFGFIKLNRKLKKFVIFVKNPLSIFFQEKKVWTPYKECFFQWCGPFKPAVIPVSKIKRVAFKGIPHIP